MNYQESFTSLLKQYGLETLDDVFLVRSYLSDRIGNSVTDLELLDAYYQLNSNEVLLHVVKSLQLRESKNQIMIRILKADKKYSVLQYIQSMEPLLLYLYPNEYELVDENKIKKQSAAIKVVRAPREKKENITSFLVQNHNSPTSPKAPTPVVKKPRKAKNPFPNVTYSKVYINCECRKLMISYSENDQIQIFDSWGKDYYNASNVAIYTDKVDIKINAKRKYIFIEIPKKEYDYISVNHDGKDLILLVDPGKVLKAKKADIISKRGPVSTNLDIKDLCINKESGKITVSGNVVDLLVNSNECDIEDFVESSTQKTVEINNNKGNIDLYTIGAAIHPSINHAFRRIKNVDGTYDLGSRKLKLKLNTQKGKIYVG